MGGVAKAVGGLFGAGAENSYRAEAPAMQPGLLDKINQSYGGMSGIGQNQSALAQALLAQTQGQGPNPAQLMMQQATDRANQQGAGMLASAKGISPALAARLASQNTMQNQAQAAQNAGILGAQQQLAAQGQLQNLYGQQAQQNLNQQSILQGAYSGNQNAQMQAQGINAQISGQNQAAQNQLAGALIGAAGAGAASYLGRADGGFIPGRAAFGGDSYANDTVPTMLSPGEIVVPRTKAKDPELAKEFIEHLFERKGKKKKGA